jgi:hypothetical protein
MVDGSRAPGVVPWAIINSTTNICENCSAWDGVTPWSPAPGYYAVAIGDSGAWTWWSYDPATQTWSPPPEPIPNPDAGTEPTVL